MRRSWTFLIDLEMVSDGREPPSEVSVKVSSQSDIRNYVKIPSVLDSRKIWTFLMDLEMVSDWRVHQSEVSVKLLSRSDIRNHVKTPPFLQVSSWSLGGHWHSWWTWRWWQIGGTIHPKCLKISSRSDIRNHVKTPPELKVSLRSWGGHGHSWWTWRWCQMEGNIHQKCLWKFHQDPTCFGWLRDDLEFRGPQQEPS